MAAVANVAINVDSRGAVGKLRDVAKRSKELEKASQGASNAISRTSREVKKAGAAASQASAGFSKLTKAIGGIVTAAAAFQTLRFTIVKTAELETQTRSLKVLTGSLESAKSIIQELQAVGAVTPFTSTELIDTAKRLKAFGVETNKLVDTTKRLGDLAGATGAELNGIATAYGQIQAKGKLQTEELLQLQERGIDIASTLKEEYKLTGAEFTKALEKGQISAEAVEFALQKLTDAGGKYANGAIAQSDTLAGKFSTLQDGITRTAQALGQVLSPALKVILSQAIGVVNSINNALAAGRRIQQFGIGAAQRNELFQQAGKEAEQLAKLRGGGRIDPAEFTRLRDERFRDLIEAFGYETGQIQPKAAVPTIETPSIPQLLGGGGAGGGGGRRAANGGTARLKEQKDLTEAMNALLQKRESIRFSNNDLLKIQVDKEIEIQRIMESQLQPLDRARKLEKASNDAKERAAQLLEPIVKGVMDLQNGANAATEASTKLNNVYRSIGDTITTGVVDSLAAAVEGTKTLADVASDTLRNLANILLQFGISSLTEGLGSTGGILGKLFGGGRALGGTVRAGSSYVVGERGPELLTVGRSGSIAPNSSLGGGANVVVNVDASGSNAQGNNQNARQLGNVIGAAVQAELIKQQRPGGLLAR